MTTNHRLDIGSVLAEGLNSPNECDRNGEVANVVDGLFAIARAINRLAETQNRVADEHKRLADAQMNFYDWKSTGFRP